MNFFVFDFNCNNNINLKLFRVMVASGIAVWMYACSNFYWTMGIELP